MESLRPKLKKRGLSITTKRSLTGWSFLIPAALLILILNFYPMFQAFLLSLQTGKGTTLNYADPIWYNFARLFKDVQFLRTLKTTFIYLIIQVPLMLITALILANILNDRNLKFKGLFRTMIFLPCATSLVSYSLVFRTMFAQNGFINTLLVGIGILGEPYNWLATTWSAQMVIILGLLWRWTGYNMIFYLAALQNLDGSIFEAARIDGANSIQTFTRVTVPQIRPMILLTAIMSTNGTLQLFDESWNLTYGNPAGTTMSISHYLYQVSFMNAPNFGYAAAISISILIIVAILAAIQMRVGDKR